MRKKAMRRNRASDIPVIVLLAALAMFGCKKEQPPPPSPPPQAKPAAQPVKPVQNQASSARPAEGQQATGLDFGKMKDPFKPFISDMPKAPEKTGLPQVSPNALPIERYEVASFRVTGIIVGLNQNTAMVVDPGGKAYVVKPGMTIGTNNGRITRITSTAVEVEERSKDAGSRAKKRVVKLSLPQKK